MLIKQIFLSWGFRLGALLLQVGLFLLVSKKLVGDELTVYLYLSAILGYFVLTEFGTGFYVQNRVTTALLFSNNRLLDYSLTIIRNVMGINYLIALILIAYTFLFDYSVFILGVALLFASTGSSIINRFLIGAKKAFLVPILSFSSALLSFLLIYCSSTNNLSIVLLFIYIPLIVLNTGAYLYACKYIESPLQKSLRFSRLFLKTKDYLQFMILGVLVTQMDKYFISLRDHDIDFYLFSSKIFMFLMSFYSMGLQLIMPKLRELYHLNKINKGLYNVFLYSSIFSVLTLIFVLVLMLLGEPLLGEYIPRLTIDSFTLIVFIVYTIARFFSDGVASFAAVVNEDGYLKKVAAYQLLIVVALSLAYINSYDPYTLIIPMLVAILFGIPLVLRKILVRN